MSHETISIRTADGDCRAFVATPAQAGPGDKFPPVIFFMDGLAIRPALFPMIQRIADIGYVVLMPDMFYRAGPYEPIDAKAAFASGNVRDAIAHVFGSTDNRRAAEDTAFFLDYLDSRTDISTRKVGTTGYCMGGAISLTVAGTYPDRIAAAASFHGGSLATDDPLSPHLLVPRISGRIVIAGAEKDQSYPIEMKARLDKALSAAGIVYDSEIWEDMLHGWTMTDLPVYNQGGAERHFTVLEKLFAATLHD